MSNEFDYKLKLILVGDTNVGKSSFFNILKNEDTVFTSSTVGVDFTSKIYYIKNNKIKITIWDTGGQEKFECIVRSYFRELSCVILMFDLTKIDSFNNLEKWLKLIELENHCDHNHSILLLGNKKDINNPNIVKVSTNHILEDNSFLITKDF